MAALQQSEEARIGEHPSLPFASRADYHALAAPVVAAALDVDTARGLCTAEVEKRRKQHGPNTLQSVRPTPAWRLLLNQFTSLIVALLACAAAVSWATSSHAEALAIVAVLLFNAMVGFATEWQSGRALDALRRQSRAAARVRRDGHQTSLDAEQLVPGDLIILNAGDRVPADARLITAAGLRADESVLTGESIPVKKTAEPVMIDAPLAERQGMLYLSTTITAGRAEAIVTATGAQTELGRIGRLVAEAPSERTPLEIRLAELGRRLIYIVLSIAVIVMIAGWLRGTGFWMMVEVGISLAVAAVPEALPAVTTLILALGVLRMARARAIVRRLPAVETLGGTTIICTDKTGTLTENRLTVREYRLSDGRLIDLDNEPPALRNDDLFSRAVRVSVLCNEASLSVAPSGKAHVGDPTETALLEAARQLGVGISGLRMNYPKLAELPFDASTMRMITTHGQPTADRLCAMKGAPAVVLQASSDYVGGDSHTHPLADETRAAFTKINNEMADRALRVLALAEKQIAQNSPDSAIASGYTFLGLVGMNDPPRQGVLEALEEAQAAGIRVAMLTGDQVNTARAIARELRLDGQAEQQAVHAHDLEGLDRAGLIAVARQANVFARVSPADKLRIVEALVEAGEVVAVTGDGVNDAPALKRASIGIAMGERGTEAAKEAADVVLTDDNFATLIKAIEGGRTIYTNITRFVHLMFSKNLAEVLVIFLAIAGGWPLPLLPLQILWMNLVTDVFPAMAVALEPPSPGVMSYHPRRPGTSLLSRRFMLLIGWQGAMLTAITLPICAWAINRYGGGAHTQTLTLMTLVAVQLGHMFNCRSRRRSAFDGLFRNPFIWMAAGIVVLLQLLAVYLPPLARVLGTVPLAGEDWLLTGLAVLLPIAIVEAVKWLVRKHAAAQTAHALIRLMGCVCMALTVGLALEPPCFSQAAKAKRAPPLTRQDVLESEQRLTELGYWAGPVDGRFDDGSRHALIAFQKIENRARTGRLTRDEMQALRTAQRPAPRESGYFHVEVDIGRQVLFVVDGGAVTKALPVSSGSGKPFTSEGWTRNAVTPTGRFTAARKINGWRKSPLGLLYYPIYFLDGVAIHGNPSVPVRPASHGCIRIPMFAAKALSEMIPLGTIVLVYDSGANQGDADAP